MYHDIFLLGYYGLMRIGELTSGSHPLRTEDINITVNKNKMLLVLYTSKTHGWNLGHKRLRSLQYQPTVTGQPAHYGKRKCVDFSARLSVLGI